MGVHVIAVYRPKEGRQADLEAEIRTHVPLLRRLGLATDFPSLALRTSDGTVIEHFEWVDEDAMRAAHEHPEVLAMWGRYESCCTYGTLADLSNATSVFPEFELLGSF